MRDVQHLQVTLQQAGLTGSTVLHDVGEVEFNLLSQDHDGEVGLVHLRLGAFRERLAHGIGLAHGYQLPLSEAGEDFINIVTEFVNAGGGELTASAGYFPFGRVTSVDDCYRLITGHFIRSNNFPSQFFQG